MFGPVNDVGYNLVASPDGRAYGTGLNRLKVLRGRLPDPAWTDEAVADFTMPGVVRTTIGGAIVGLGAMVASLIFGASLSHLLGSPPLYGVTWDTEIWNNDGPGAVPAAGPLLRADPDIATAAFIQTGIDFRLGGHVLSGFAYTPVKGTFAASMLTGGGDRRAPAGRRQRPSRRRRDHHPPGSRPAGQRRRDLAILKMLGFTQRDVGRAVAWQATTPAAVTLAVGVPLGIAAGRTAWRLFAGHLGVVPEVTTPVVLLVLAATATVLLANLISIVPAMTAMRIRPASVLREE